MNSFGRIFRVSIYGESHGKEIGVLIDGVPPGIKLNKLDFQKDLLKRRAQKVGTTQRREDDNPSIMSGVFQGKTTGSPILISFYNKDIKSKDYLKIKNYPRPGHADFVALMKYKGFGDYRGGGAFSGRLTLGLVAGGVVAKKIINGVFLSSKVISVKKEKTKEGIQKVIQDAINEGDSLGGVVECKVRNVPIGQGEPFFDSVESLISHAVFAIPGVRGIEFGRGFLSAEVKGSENNDEILNLKGETRTNYAGGINGGITNGNEIILRVAFKPTSSISIPQNTVNLKTGEKHRLTVKGRHDPCFIIRTPVIVESAVAITLADLSLR